MNVNHKNVVVITFESFKMEINRTHIMQNGRERRVHSIPVRMNVTDALWICPTLAEWFFLSKHSFWDAFTSTGTKCICMQAVCSYAHSFDGSLFQDFTPLTERPGVFPAVAAAAAVGCGLDIKALSSEAAEPGAISGLLWSSALILTMLFCCETDLFLDVQGSGQFKKGTYLALEP